MTGALRGAGRYLAVTRAAIGRHLYALWALGLLAAGIEGFGILLFIPILMRLVEQDAEAPAGRVAGAIAGWAEGRSIGVLLAQLVLLFAAKGALVFAIGVYRARVFNRARARMRLDVFDALGRARIRSVEAKRVGALGNLLVHEIDYAGYAMARLCAGLGSATTAVLLFAIAVALDPALSAVLACSGAVSLLLVRAFSRVAMPLSRATTGKAGGMASLAVESLHAFKYLRATGRFSMLRREIGNAIEDARQLDDRSAVVNHLRHSLREPLLVLWIAAVFYLFVVVLRYSLGVITDGILFFYRVSVELSIFQDHWHEFAQRVGSIDAFRMLRSELDHEAEVEGGSAPLVFEKGIRLEGVAFHYGGTRVLHGLDIEIPKLRSVALVGASGAGKSTIVDLVAGCLEPTAGAVRIDGVDLREIRRAAYRSVLGYVTQESVMFSGSIERNVTMCWDREVDAAELARAREAAALASGLDFIEALEHGWQSEVGESGLRLSGGERQRIAIARELYRNPELLIFDEATSALDSLSERGAPPQRSDGHFRKLCEIQSLV